MPDVSIELPPIPPQPTADSTPAQVALYLDILRLHVSAASTDALNAQTAQMVKMVEATERQIALGQQVLDQPQATSSGFSETFVMGLLRLVLDKPGP